MKHQIREIEERVFALLDENPKILEERTDFADPGTSAVTLVRELLPDAARETLLTIPLSQIGECVHLNSTVSDRVEFAAGIKECSAATPSVTYLRDGLAQIKLPDDFLRLVNFRMNDWVYGVSTPLSIDSDSYRLRMAVRPHSRRRGMSPGVVILKYGEIRTMQIFGSLTGSTIAEFDYIAEPEIDEDIIELPQGTFVSVCECLAEKIRTILQNGIRELD